MKKPGAIENHPSAVRRFTDIFMILLIAWSIYASIHSYKNSQQILTFYTVELLAVLFVKLHPVFTTVLILGSYLINYLILNFGVAEGLINPYNYTMLAVLSAVGAIINYRLTINYISEKNKADILNQSLEIIANHDSTTRLQNRYALNQRIPDYLDRDICVAMGDINKFKTVNDTYGHTTGDDVLKAFSDILIKYFPHDSIFRYGGDEFLIIESVSSQNDILEKLRLVNEEFASVKFANIQITLSCSFGCITAHPMHPQDLFAALAKADKILYEEK
jgi:diguanylate cyclase (GGDEF)-like protein